jgi:hypothetical protein
MHHLLKCLVYNLSSAKSISIFTLVLTFDLSCQFRVVYALLVLLPYTSSEGRRIQLNRVIILSLSLES